MNVRRLSLLLLLLCAGAAGARSVTGLSLSFDASMQPVATVSLDAGETGDDHAIYLAFDMADRGGDPADWAACQRAGRVAAGATSASATVAPFVSEGGYTTVRAFLVENALPYDTLVESIRQTGTQYLDAGVRAGPGSTVRADFSLDTNDPTQQRLFGERSYDRSDPLNLELYIGGGGGWSATMVDSQYWNNSSYMYRVTGAAFAAGARMVATMDVPNGLVTVSNAVSGASSTLDVTQNPSNPRTKTTDKTLLVFAERENGDVKNVCRGGNLYGFSVETDEDTVCDLHPCSVDGEGGAWDAVSGGVRLSLASNPFEVGGDPLPAAPLAAETVLSSSAAAAIQVVSERTVSRIAYSEPGPGTGRVDVAFTTARLGDAHALYLAFDTEDRGTNLADWAAFQRVGRLAANDTAAGADLAAFVAESRYKCCRAFVVENARPYDTLVESIRQTGSQHLDTGVHLGPNTVVRADFSLDTNNPTQQRLFGERRYGTVEGRINCGLYIGGNGGWSATIVDSNHANDSSYMYRVTGAAFAAGARMVATMDVPNGLVTVSNTVSGASSTIDVTQNPSNPRTGTTLYPLIVFAEWERPNNDWTVTHRVEGGNLYGFSVSENGTALCDLRPCAVGGVGGAWDAVSGEVRLSETGTPFGVGGPPVADAPAPGETAVAVSRAIRLSPFPAGTVVVVR